MTNRNFAVIAVATLIVLLMMATSIEAYANRHFTEGRAKGWSECVQMINDPMKQGQKTERSPQ